ncbi:MAG: hypothetical protein KatS3mg087_1830 [Patescibacteria group bacterium]|nr:MAG: hypothetical protein KatS3mg087_1830 [Patescibacteria group bacterium]
MRGKRKRSDNTNREDTTIRISRKLARKLRMIAAIKNVTMKDLVEEAIMKMSDDEDLNRAIISEVVNTEG